jgi:hypothetical protein
MDYLASKKVWIIVNRFTQWIVSLFTIQGPPRRFGCAECFAGRRWSGQSGRFWYGKENVLRGQLRKDEPGISIQYHKKLVEKEF